MAPYQEINTFINVVIIIVDVNTMAFSQSHGHIIQSKSQKKRLTDAQVKLLEASFGPDKKLEAEKKLQLAWELGLQPRQVAVWYQNKKARWKTQVLNYHFF